MLIVPLVGGCVSFTSTKKKIIAPRHWFQDKQFVNPDIIPSDWVVWIMRSTKDLVSVIIPVKNSSLYIVDCVNSILHQTHQNFEILICDDHSCDNSLELIEALNDDRIIIFKMRALV